MSDIIIGNPGNGSVAISYPTPLIGLSARPLTWEDRSVICLPSDYDSGKQTEYEWYCSSANKDGFTEIEMDILKAELGFQPRKHEYLVRIENILFVRIPDGSWRFAEINYESMYKLFCYVIEAHTLRFQVGGPVFNEAKESFQNAL